MLPSPADECRVVWKVCKEVNNTDTDSESDTNMAASSIDSGGGGVLNGQQADQEKEEEQQEEGGGIFQDVVRVRGDAAAMATWQIQEERVWRRRQKRIGSC